MLANKRSNPIVANAAPANVSIECSTRIAVLFFWAMLNEASLPDIAIKTTIDMVRAMPIEIIIPSIIPKAIKSSDKANNMTITTPGHGMHPTTKADKIGLTYCLFCLLSKLRWFFPSFFISL